MDYLDPQKSLIAWLVLAAGIAGVCLLVWLLNKLLRQLGVPSISAFPEIQAGRLTPEASTAPLSWLPLRLLPGWNQFPGGARTRCRPAPFTAH